MLKKEIADKIAQFIQELDGEGYERVTITMEEHGQYTILTIHEEKTQ